jgi:hypothetical protein
MPHINGRYYANPAYGRGVERARAQERQRQSPSRAHSPSAHKAHRGKDDYDPAATPAGIANQIYNETSGLRPTTQRGPGSDLDFQQARIAIGHVIRNRAAAGRPGGLPSPMLEEREAQASQRMGSAAYDARRESLYAARRATKETDPTRGATGYYLDHGQGAPRGSGKPVAIFGPFRNVAGKGDVPPGKLTRIVVFP